MNYVARLWLGYPYSESISEVMGTGKTEAEAVADCIAKAQQLVSIDIEAAPGVILPPRVAEQIPAEFPDGYGLFVLARGNHNSGDIYDWRIFAVRLGPHLICKSFGGKPGVQINVSVPGQHFFLDCNADYAFLLPQGSMECVEGEWVPQEKASYGY